MKYKYIYIYIIYICACFPCLKLIFAQVIRWSIKTYHLDRLAPPFWLVKSSIFWCSKPSIWWSKMENGPFINDFPNNTSIQFGDFPASNVWWNQRLVLMIKYEASFSPCPSRLRSSSVYSRRVGMGTKGSQRFSRHRSMATFVDSCSNFSLSGNELDEIELLCGSKIKYPENVCHLFDSLISKQPDKHASHFCWGCSLWPAMCRWYFATPKR